MVSEVLPPHHVFVAGTFNDWSPGQPSHQMDYDAEEDIWEARIALDRGAHAFKFAVDGNWEQNWGDDGTSSVIPPLGGRLQREGANILLSIPQAGLYLFRIGLRSLTWEVFPRQVGTGPVAALQPRDNLAWLAEFLESVERKGAHAATESWFRSRLLTGEANGQFPLMRGDDVVFISWGQPPMPVSVCGTFNDWSTTSHRMTPVPNTPLQYISVRLPRSIRQEYKFHLEGHWFQDPHNPLVAWDGVDNFGPGSFNSVLPTVPSANVAHLLWIKQFYSLFLNDTCDIWVLLPPGYEHGGGDRYPVVYVNDGNESITRGQLDSMGRLAMDQEQAETMLLVFVGLSSADARAYQYIEPEGRSRYARFLTRELVPYIDSRFSTRAEPASRALAGSSWGGFNAFYTAWHHPDVFGKAGAQGGSFHVNDYEMVRILRDRAVQPVAFYLDSSRPLPGIGRGDNHAQSLSVAQALDERGYRYLHLVTDGQRHDWTSWRERFPDLLSFLFPGAKS
ncbi:MAG TPA: alpha/beta hydrolase-fold protein [Candidatus Xenobia bacterium]|jgi:enterochelin esterase family protein